MGHIHGVAAEEVNDKVFIVSHGRYHSILLIHIGLGALLKI